MWLFLLGVSLGLAVVGYLGLVRAWRVEIEFQEGIGERHDAVAHEIEVTKPGDTFHWRPHTQTGTVPPTGVRMHRLDPSAVVEALREYERRNGPYRYGD